MATTTDIILPEIRKNLERGIVGTPLAQWRRSLRRRSWLPTRAAALSACLLLSCGAWAYAGWNGRGVSDMRVKDAAIVAQSMKYPPASRAAAVLQLRSEAMRVRDALTALLNDPEVGPQSRRALDSLVEAFQDRK